MPYAPAEWSDETQLACVIAQVAVTGVDLASAEALEAIAGALAGASDQLAARSGS